MHIPFVELMSLTSQLLRHNTVQNRNKDLKAELKST